MRRFNRFYTRQIGVLRKNYLGSPYSLGEMRVLYELAHGGARTASDIGRALDLDAGYLSRVLRNFEKRGLITRKTSATTPAKANLALTARGAKIFAPFEKRSQDFVGGMLGTLNARQQARLVAAMADDRDAARRAARPQSAAHYILRAPRHGDFGWIVSRHAELYAQEYGWTEPFEGLCAQIVADFVNNYDAKRERCWIAEMNGENVGCVMLVKDSARASPAFACCWSIRKRAAWALASAWSTNACSLRAQAGYKKITLWTHSVLTAAATSTRRPASRSPPARNDTAGARTWWRSIGIWICKLPRAPRSSASKSGQSAVLARAIAFTRIARYNARVG